MPRPYLYNRVMQKECPLCGDRMHLETREINHAYPGNDTGHPHHDPRMGVPRM